MSKTTQTQSEMILQDLLAGICLTPLDAMTRYNCFRLGARIWDLRRQGHPIKSRLIKTPTGKMVSLYYLPAETPANASAQPKTLAGDAPALR